MKEMIKYTYTAGSGLTPEQLASLEEAEKYPIVFSKDCPKLTDEQLAEFKPVNFATMEERYQAMIEMGIIKAEEKEPVPV